MQTLGFTVATPNYLAHAKSLRRSFLLHQPDCRFIICLVDYELPQRIDKDIEIISLSQLTDSRIKGMTERYNPFELSCALKPFFAYHILSQNKINDRLVYLDCDTRVFDRFTNISNAAIIISPHRTVNVNFLPGMDNFSVIDVLRYGVYNAGYFELTHKPEALKFLDWWMNLLENHGYDRPDKHLFMDQPWLNAVHSYFDDVYVNKNPGYNVSYWNLIERKITRENNKWFVNNTPLVFYHFAKFNPEIPDRLVNFEHPMLSFSALPELKHLFEEYRQHLFKENYSYYKTLSYPFATTKKNNTWRKIIKKVLLPLHFLLVMAYPSKTPRYSSEN